MSERNVLVNLIPPANRINYRSQTDQRFLLELRDRFRENGYDDYPVEVVHDVESDVYYLWDGNHRIEASEMAHLDMIPANVTEGTYKDAVRLALTESNKLQRRNRAAALSSDDLQNCAELALQEDFTEEMTRKEVATALSISLGTIDRALRELRNKNISTSSEKRKARIEFEIRSHFMNNPEDSVNSVAETFGVRRDDVSTHKQYAEEMLRLRAEWDTLTSELGTKLMAEGPEVLKRSIDSFRDQLGSE